MDGDPHGALDSPASSYYSTILKWAVNHTLKVMMCTPRLKLTIVVECIADYVVTQGNTGCELTIYLTFSDLPFGLSPMLIKLSVDPFEQFFRRHSLSLSLQISYNRWNLSS
jgi:hypothetical protein